MGMFVNPDNSAFQVALNSEIYVDKTELIKYTNRVLNTLQGYICNSRPRRFGKSVTANMLTAYYSRGCDSEAIFAGLEISKSADFKKHLNQYDVIHLDIQWCMEPAGGPEQVVSYISEKTIAELKGYYSDVLTENTGSLPEALSRINAATGKNLSLSSMNGTSLFVISLPTPRCRRIISTFSEGCLRGQSQRNMFSWHT